MNGGEYTFMVLQVRSGIQILGSFLYIALRINKSRPQYSAT